MPAYKIAHKPDIMTTYLRGVVRHPPEFLRINHVRFEPTITVSAAGAVTLQDPPAVTFDSGQAFIVQRIKGYAASGVWDSTALAYRPVKPAELAQFRFNILDQSRSRRQFFDSPVSIVEFLQDFGGSDFEWNRGDYLTIPSTTLESTWTAPAALTNFAGTGVAGADIRIGVVLIGVSISKEVLEAILRES